MKVPATSRKQNCLRRRSCRASNLKEDFEGKYHNMWFWFTIEEFSDIQILAVEGKLDIFT